MAEIATGNAYDAGQTGSGVGAVMFTPNHRDITDIGADWNKQNAEDEERNLREQHYKQQQARSLIQDLNLDTKGALDSDAPFLREQMANLNNQQSQLYKTHNGNPNTPEALTQMQSITGGKNLFKTLVEQSAGHKAEIVKAISALDADKAGENYDKDATSNLLAKFRTLPIDERQKLLDANGGSLLVQQPPLLSKIAKESLAHPDKSIDEWEKTPIPNVYQQTTTKTHSPERLADIARNDYQGNRNAIKAANADFDKLPPEAQKRFQQMAEQTQELEARAGKDSRIVAPQEMFLREYYTGQNPKEVTAKTHNTQFNPFDLAAFKHGLKREDDGESYLLQQGANTMNGVSAVFDKEPVAKRTATAYDPTSPASINGAVVDATGNPVINTTGGKLNPDEYGIAPYFTGAKNGTADVRIPVTSKGKDGKLTQVVEAGKPVYRYAKVDNDVRRVIGVGEYDANGDRTGVKPLVADARSLIAAGYEPDAPESEWKDDPNAYRTFDKGYMEGLARNNGVKDERMSKFFKSVGGYGQRVTNIANSSDPNARRIGQATTQTEKAVTNDIDQAVSDINSEKSEVKKLDIVRAKLKNKNLSTEQVNALKGQFVVPSNQKEIDAMFGKKASTTPTPAEFDAQWSKAKKGDVVIGVNGKPYTKK